ncbi:MAG: N-acetylmuramoyl-L-alanine amidase [Peptococcaceae bacterium]|nr:N-acetylmuramoyl-L-alanine amidase [Peptococcaceae bacterium]
MSKKILIDPGHGGTDPGRIGWGIKEKDPNLAVGLALAKKLLIYDAEVKLTRQDDDSISLDQRSGLAKVFGPDLCISCHHNGVSSQTATGVEVFYSHSRPAAQALAARISAGIAKAGLCNRGAKTWLNASGTDYHHMIRKVESAATTALIVEAGFLSNPADAELIRTEAYQDLEAQVMADAAAEYLGLELKAKASTVPAWQEAGFASLIQRGIITTPEYWQGKLDQPITVGELMGILAKL